MAGEPKKRLRISKVSEATLKADHFKSTKKATAPWNKVLSKWFPLVGGADGHTHYSDCIIWHGAGYLLQADGVLTFQGEISSVDSNDDWHYILHLVDANGNDLVQIPPPAGFLGSSWHLIHIENKDTIYPFAVDEHYDPALFNQVVGIGMEFNC